MELVKVGAAVLNQTPLAWEANRRNILGAIAAARAAGVGILCLPEMCISGYGCEDAFHSPGVHATAFAILEEIVPHTAGIVVSVGLPVMHHKAVFNANCLIADGRILGFVAKRFLAGDGIHYEPRWFKPWPAGRRAELSRGGARHPIGDIVFDVGGIKLGFEICEDAWVANRPGIELALQGIDVILNPSASHFAFGKLAVRQRFVVEGSRAFGVTYLYSNLLGNEAGRAIYDGGALIASGGQLLAVGPRFSYADFQLTTAVVDVDITRMAQARTASFKPSLESVADDTVVARFAWPAVAADVAPTTVAVAQTPWETGPHLKEEEFTRAVALALFDYMRKSRSSGFVLSLSGGADSSTVACLVRALVELGAGELGREGFAARLGHIQGFTSAMSPSEMVRRLLVCVYQATENSSQVTRSAAQQVAESVGAEFLQFEIDSLVKNYVQMVGQALDRAFTWETDDLALQNIQARVRAPGVWMVANVRNALLVATSNRSEAAVGYATMDGDTCGGISPIAGIDKQFIRQWLRWMEAQGPTGLHAFPVLALVNQQQPTPELRPQTAAQTDEDDLMPFDILDRVERASIRDKRSPVECFRLLRAERPQYGDAQLVVWLERFFRLWCRNQWKRERFAPSFHLDDENLDPKTWCRFPILSGGYERELAELRDYVARTPSAAAGAR